MRNYAFPSSVVSQPIVQTIKPQPAAARTVPFDYVFQLELKGARGNKVQDVVEISVEGIFVALSVGYSLVTDQRKSQRTFQPEINERTTAQSPTLIPFFQRPVPPRGGGDGVILSGGAGPADVGLVIGDVGGGDTGPLSLRSLGVTATPDSEISILSLSGTAVTILKTGRIGPSGFAQVDFPPIALTSRAVLRVWDRTHDLFGQVFEVGTPATPVIGFNPVTGGFPAPGDKSVSAYGSEGSVKVSLLKGSTGEVLADLPVDLTEENIPFRGRRFRAEVSLGQEQLSAGDALLIRTEDTDSAGLRPSSVFTISRPRMSTITLGALAAGLERIGADLTNGFRVSADIANLAAADTPLDQLSAETLKTAFQTGSSAAGDVSFLYALDVTGNGREYQNKAIHNIAGLGIANGDRPFRPFAKPVMFEPRSSIRIQVEEISGPPGTLFIVLQGYKMLGTGRIPA